MKIRRRKKQKQRPLLRITTMYVKIYPDA
jgi:hypothetical protein